MADPWLLPDKPPFIILIENTLEIDITAEMVVNRWK